MQRYEKLYIVTRRDLRPGLQAAQVAHAAFTFAYEHRPLAAQWQQESNFLIVLSVADEDELKELGEIAESNNLPVSWFTEPDIGDQLTAIAIAPSPATVAITAHLSLALSETCSRENIEITTDVMSVDYNETQLVVKIKTP